MFNHFSKLEKSEVSSGHFFIYFLELRSVDRLWRRLVILRICAVTDTGAGSALGTALSQTRL